MEKRVCMQLTIDVNESVMDKVLFFLKSLKSDVKIIDNSLDIEMLSLYDSDYKCIENGRKEREEKPQNYGTLNDVEWD